jgi:hypothetical protein
MILEDHFYEELCFWHGMVWKLQANSVITNSLGPARFVRYNRVVVFALHFMKKLIKNMTILSNKLFIRFKVIKEIF